MKFYEKIIILFIIFSVFLLKRTLVINLTIFFSNFENILNSFLIKPNLGQLKWATEQCSSANYVMHVDDDVFVDLHNVVRYLSKKQQLVIFKKYTFFKALT